MMTMMATGDDDNDVNINNAMGNEVDDDDGTMGDNNDNADDDVDDNDDGNGDSVMGSGATGYNDDNDGNVQRQ